MPEVAAVDVEVVEDVELVVEGVLLRADPEPGRGSPGPSAAGSIPRIRSSPPLTGETAAIIRIVEDLPAPLGPRKPNASPRRTSRSMPFTASKSPNDLRRPRGPDHGVAHGQRPYRGPPTGPNGFLGVAGGRISGRCRCRAQGWASARPSGPVQRAHARLVRGGVRRADAGPGRGVGGDRGGRHALVVAPTGSGKTLSAFLWALDRLLTERRRPRQAAPLPGPLRLPAQGAGVDVERNLRAPLTGIRHTADRLGAPRPRRHGRRPLGRHPGRRAPQLGTHAARHPDHHARVAVPDAHLARPARALRGVETVIVDEVHAVAGTKRGAHLALSLERLDALLDAARAADRAVRHGAPARGGRPVPRRHRAGRGRGARRRPRSGTSRSSSRSRT